MELGVNLGYFGMGVDQDNVAVAQEADRLGYAVAWAAEAYGSDGPTVLPWIGAADRAHRPRRGRHADPGTDAGDDRDDRGDPRHPVRRPVPAGARGVGARR